MLIILVYRDSVTHNSKQQVGLSKVVNSHVFFMIVNEHCQKNLVSTNFHSSGLCH